MSVIKKEELYTDALEEKTRGARDALDVVLKVTIGTRSARPGSDHSAGLYHLQPRSLTPRIFRWEQTVANFGADFSISDLVLS